MSGGDNFRRTYTVDYTFSNGEQPDADKLSNAFKQGSNATRLIEKALGDLWNDGGSDFSGIGFLNYIANLARAISSMNILSPRTVETQLSSYTEDLSQHAGKTDFYLQYAPTNVVSTTSSALTTQKISLDLVQDGGDYYIDGAHVYCVTAIQSGDSITYDCYVPGDTDSPHGYNDNFDMRRVEFNVIPDPATTGWGSSADMLQMVDNGTYYTITLPEIDSSVATNRSSPLSPTGGFGGRKYKLPEFLSHLGTSTTLGLKIPDGFMYLWDAANSTIVHGLEFYYVSESTINIAAASGASLPSVNNNRYALVLVSLPISYAIDNLRDLLLTHKHRKTYDAGSNEYYADGEPIEHSDLSQLVTPQYDATTNPYCPIGKTVLAIPIAPIFGKSRWGNDDHIQYLHRGGSWSKEENDIDSSSINRDIYDNAMYGDLLFASSVYMASSPHWLHLNEDSRSIYFGNVNGPRLYYDYSLDALKLENKDFYTPNEVVADAGITTDTGYVRLKKSDISTVKNFLPGDFTATEPATKWELFQASDVCYLLYNPSGSNSNYAVASVQLPYNCLVSKLEMLYELYSNGTDTVSITVEFQRASGTSTANSTPTWTTLTTLNVSSTSSTGVVWASSSLTEYIDSDNYMYRLYVTGTATVNSSARIYQVRITYSYQYVYGR